MDQPTACLDIRAVSKDYGSVIALRDVTLTVSRGEIVGLLGANGAGKSTLIGIVAGLLRPDRGEALVEGFAPSAHSSRAHHVGLVPQDVGVYETVTVGEHLRLFGRLYGAKGERLTGAMRWAAGTMGLTGLLDRRAAQLSGGQRRRLHVACALVGRPRVLLLDEPTANCDVESRAAILSAVGALAELGICVIYTTHVLSELDELAPRLVVLRSGRIVADQSLAQWRDMLGSAVVLTFTGAPPEAALAMGTPVDGHSVRIPCQDPGADLVRLLDQLGHRRHALRSVQVSRPTVEHAYRALSTTPAGTP
ncbi:ABC transporter ATP-binding protein [Actinosynnema sp. NPDC023587]|uniref:ABC transporter ATP-binding protein n=1 Tax=Actinosynnema sp. NPDC023587 TaxID=3154695 RepID=UPI0033F68A80